MTTETPICSISSNVNPIGSTKKLSSDSNHEQRKRNFIFNNDKIENLQVHENEATSPSSTWNKVSSEEKKLSIFIYSIKGMHQRTSGKVKIFFLLFS